MIDSVRTRLTLWYVAALALMLVAFSLGVYALQKRLMAARLDDELRASLEAVAGSLARELAEGESFAQAAQSVIDELRFPQQGLSLYDSEGHLLASSPLPGASRVLLPLAPVPSGADVSFDDPPGTGITPRVATRRICPQAGMSCYVAVAAASRVEMRAELSLLRNGFALAIPLALLVAGVGGWLLARRSLLPVLAMAESARRISAENLAARLPITNPRDELGRLAATFNELLARLQAAFTQQRQFMADASHELRTPLAVLRTAASVTLEQPRRAEDEYREALVMIDAQTQRLGRIVEEMFTLARADAGSRELQWQDFYLDELLAETARAAAALAARKQVVIVCAPAPETLHHGDEELLRRMLLNLLDNAIRHTPPGGQVTLHLTREADLHLITVTDTGTGIPAAAQAHIFERFYRGDPARVRTNNSASQGGGAGLGLSIARWIAEAHGGTLTLQHSGKHGSSFRVVLPLTKQMAS